MSNIYRKRLLRAVEVRFLPFLISQGFIQKSLSDIEKKSAEMRAAFPFGYFKRPNGVNLELLEIQFDKRGSASFVVNFGTASPEGVTLPWAHIGQDELSASGLPEAYRLYKRKYFARWFSLWSLPGDIDSRAVRTVDCVIDLYPEIDAWFTRKKIGPHLRRIGFPHAEKQTG